MMLAFTKYQGTGNDFIMIDCTKTPDFSLTNEQIEVICDRRFGIGADGVILIFTHPEVDFLMRYHNSDGSMSFCGNGGRCAVHFAKSLGLTEKEAEFEAIDGIHTATIDGDIVSLKMQDVGEVNKSESDFVIDTGSPHFIRFTQALEEEDIVDFGKKVRYSPTYKEEGINVNLAEIIQANELKMLTYERGVEDETYSCGTGATAVALAYANENDLKEIDVDIHVKGGDLKVKAVKNKDGFESIYLIGPALPVFTGEIKLK